MVYEAMAALPGYVPWVPGGNSNAQDDARRAARAIIAALGAPVVQPRPDAEPRDYEYAKLHERLDELGVPRSEPNYGAIYSLRGRFDLALASPLPAGNAKGSEREDVEAWSADTCPDCDGAGERVYNDKNGDPREDYAVPRDALKPSAWLDLIDFWSVDHLNTSEGEPLREMVENCRRALAREGEKP
jgi:hypothetical protein